MPEPLSPYLPQGSRLENHPDGEAHKRDAGDGGGDGAGHIPVHRNLLVLLQQKYLYARFTTLCKR